MKKTKDNVIPYQYIDNVALGDFGLANMWVVNSTIPWVSTNMIDASVWIYGIPEPSAPTADLVGWTTDVVFSSSASAVVAWSAWDIKLADWTSYAINSGNSWTMSAITYIYHDWTSTLATTTVPQTAVGTGKLMMCVAKNSTSPAFAQFQAFGTLWQSVFITADNIAANTITANQIAANTITATQIQASTITTSQLNFTPVQPSTGDNAVNSSGKVTQINWNLITVANIDADNITAWTITGRTLQTASSWQRVVVNQSTNSIVFFNSWWSDCWGLFWSTSSGVRSVVLWTWNTQIVVLGWTTWVVMTAPLFSAQGNVSPFTSNTYDLGASTFRWRGLFLGTSW